MALLRIRVQADILIILNFNSSTESYLFKTKPPYAVILAVPLWCYRKASEEIREPTHAVKVRPVLLSHKEYHHLSTQLPSTGAHLCRVADGSLAIKCVIRFPAVTLVCSGLVWSASMYRHAKG